MVNEKAETRTRARWIPKIGRNQIKTVEMQLTKRASFNGDAKHMAREPLETLPLASP